MEFLRGGGTGITRGASVGRPERGGSLEPSWYRTLTHENPLPNLKNLLRDEKGAALLEYSLLAAGVALVSAAAVAMYGHKTNDIISAVGAIMPGAHADDNAPIRSGKLIETSVQDGAIAVDVATIISSSNTQRLGNNLGVAGLGDDDTGLILEVE